MRTTITSRYHINISEKMNINSLPFNSRQDIKRIGHVIRMDNTTLVRTTAVAWFLEGKRTVGLFKENPGGLPIMYRLEQFSVNNVGYQRQISLETVYSDLM